MKSTTRNTVNLYCLKCKITADELAMRLGISKDKVLEILKEETVIPSELVTELCNIFGCKPQDLIV